MIHERSKPCATRTRWTNGEARRIGSIGPGTILCTGASHRDMQPDETGYVQRDAARQDAAEEERADGGVQTHVALRSGPFLDGDGCSQRTSISTHIYRLSCNRHITLPSQGNRRRVRSQSGIRPSVQEHKTVVVMDDVMVAFPCAVPELGLARPFRNG